MEQKKKLSNEKEYRCSSPITQLFLRLFIYFVIITLFFYFYKVSYDSIEIYIV